MKIKTFIRISLFSVALAAICGAGFVVSRPAPAVAGTNDNLSGWAWSDTIGWISFNCTDTSSCAKTNYGVHLDKTTGNLTGYAWSDNIGWIKFGGLSGFPSTTNGSDARLVGTSFQGWARAVRGFDVSNPGNQNGGWDGWISLSGTNYGFVLNGTLVTGYAWGSDVVGWVTPFNLKYTEATNPFVDLKANGSDGPVTVAKGSGVTLTWSSGDVEPTSCVLKDDATILLTNTTSGTTVQSSLDSLHTYTYTCNKKGTNEPISDSVTVDVSQGGGGNQPTLSCIVDPPIVGVNTPVTFSASTDTAGTYTFVWSGSVTGTSVGTNSTITKSFSTIGTKKVSVMIKNGSQVLSGDCLMEVTVKVNPTLIEF